MNKNEINKVGLTLLAIGSSYAIKKILEESYKGIYDEEPPNAVTDKEIKWGHVIGWTVVSGIMASATKVLIKRYGAQHINE